MLRDLQKTFKASILEEHDAVDAYLDTLQGISNKNRIHIYRNNTFVSLKQVLVDTFPAVTSLASIEFMRYAGHEFIKKHPPKNGALMFYGADFPAFLENFEAAHSYPFLADVARLEWALSEVYDAKETPVLTKKDITPEVIEQTLHTPLTLAPHVRILHSTYPIFDLWAVTKEKSTPNIDLSKSQCVLVYRDMETLNSMATPLTAEEYTFFHYFNHTTTLETAMEETLNQYETIDFQTILGKIIHNGLLTKDTTDDTKM